LGTPSAEKRTIATRRRTNKELRTREHLTKVRSSASWRPPERIATVIGGIRKAGSELPVRHSGPPVAGGMDRRP
jgi:hypothetical protein